MDGDQYVDHDELYFQPQTHYDSVTGRDVDDETSCTMTDEMLEEEEEE